MKVMVWSVVDFGWWFDGLLKEGVLLRKKRRWALVCSLGCSLICTRCGAEEGEGRAGFVQLGALN